jgi:hypothetical protein
MAKEIISELGLKEKMQIQLAGFAGLAAFVLSAIFICAGFRLYRELALFMGWWNEPSLIDALVAGYALFLVCVFIGWATRWWLVYKWVLGGERWRSP